MDLQGYLNALRNAQDFATREQLIMRARMDLSEGELNALQSALVAEGIITDEELQGTFPNPGQEARQRGLDDLAAYESELANNPDLTDTQRAEMLAAARSEFDESNSDGDDGDNGDDGDDGDDDGGSFDSSLNAPKWILDQLNGGQVLTVEQGRRIVRAVNIEYGTSFSTIEQVTASGFLDDRTQQTFDLVEQAIMDYKPVQAVQVPLGGGRNFTIQADEFNVAKQNYGIDDDQLTFVTQLSDRLGMKSRDNIWWQMTLGLASATGMLNQLIHNEPSRPLLGQGMEEELKSGRFQVPEPDAFTFSTEAELFGSREMSDELAGALTAAGEDVQAVRRLSMRDLTERMWEGIERYNGDPVMGFLYAVDRQLTHRIAISGGDILKLDGRDMLEARSILSTAGFNGFNDFRAKAMASGFGEAEGSGFENYWNYLDAVDQARASEKAGDPEEPTPKFPDPVGIDETIRQLYQQMFLEEPDDATVAAFRSQINGAVQNAFDNDISSVNIAARAQQFLREQPQYDEFYGNKPEGLSEAEYRGQYESAQGSILGAEEAAGAPIREGLRTGKYQTTVGAAMGTTEAWDNSTFLGRLARAGEVVGRNT